MLQKSIVLLLLAFAASGCVTSAPLGNVSPPRIALVGDSWPLIMRFHGGFKQAFVEDGYRPRQVRNIAVGWSFMGLTERRMSFQGIETYRYLYEGQLDTLDEILARYPTVDIIHLSLGGADMIHDIPPNLSPAEQEAFMRRNILPNLDAVLSALQARHPDKLIALVGYDYLNFHDVIDENERTHERWTRLGFPEAIDMNEMSWRLNEIQREAVAKHPGVLFIDCLGFTKDRLGEDETLWEPSPRAGLWKDGMHLSRKGNAALARFCLEAGYRDRLSPLIDARGMPIRPEGRPAVSE